MAERNGTFGAREAVAGHGAGWAWHVGGGGLPGGEASDDVHSGELSGLAPLSDGNLLVALLAVLVGLTSTLVGCGGDAGSPTAPTGLSLSVTPQTTGVQYGTEFIMEAVGSFQSTTTFRWDFGDGTSALGERVTLVYEQSGTFSVSLEVSSGQNARRDVVVRSLLGRWGGVITGHTAVPSNRPIPITSFELTVFTVPNPSALVTPFGSTVSIDGLWADDAGCRVGRGVPGFPALLCLLRVLRRGRPGRYDSTTLRDTVRGGRVAVYARNYAYNAGVLTVGLASWNPDSDRDPATARLQTRRPPPGQKCPCPSPTDRS